MKRILFAAFVALAGTFTANAQSKIENESLTYDENNAIVTFDIHTEENSIPSNRKEVIRPFLFNEGDTLWLDAVEVYGKNRLKRERQENALKGDRFWDLEEGQFLKGITYSYSDESPLKKWMAPAHLGIKREIIGCACKDEMIETMPDEMVTAATLFYEPPAYTRRVLTDFALEDASRKWDIGEDIYEIIFKVSKTRIDSTIFNNEVTFGKILAAIDKIYSHPDFKVNEIEIAGYASPEGKQSFNRWLGENRAKALIKYIIDHRPQYNLTTANFKIVNGEENWEGLRRMTLASGMDSGEIKKIIEIIDSDAGVGRKGQLKALDGGRTYRKMLREVYPHLRSARYLAVYYDSSQDDAVEKINEANSLIRKGEYEKALQTVEPYSEDFRAYNTYAVALMLNKEFEKALPYLERAIAEGSESAKYNKSLIETELEYEETKKKEREEYLKRFE